ncbi:hypothetical protein L1987_09306 [Smallanthus sonchifolius]|uniref:Uncharacterized protein n=1 Tax=Smallanthus sonchifolius TaxID=185202 RepID=A0ACB9JNJ1_9ASTR|nr:hypothetical protein L1987_09306 [Smallanthus sonchifolius]
MISCLISNSIQGNAIADLYIGVYILPGTIFDKMNLNKLQPTQSELRLTNRTVRYPKGIAEDVLIKINEFVFPVDFVVVDIKGGTRCPLILGRLFLNTALALIDVWGGRLALSIQQ